MNHTSQKLALTGIYNYYPYGSQISSLTWEAADARFGFQGQQRDDEIAGAGNKYAYKSRIYNAPTNTMDQIDPKSDFFPSQSPYVTSGNNPIWMIDVDGERAVKKWLMKKIKRLQ